MRYAADRRSPVYEELASILRKTVGLVDVLADVLALAAEAGEVELAFMFGRSHAGARRRAAIWT